MITDSFEEFHNFIKKQISENTSNSTPLPRLYWKNNFYNEVKCFTSYGITPSVYKEYPRPTFWFTEEEIHDNSKKKQKPKPKYLINLNKGKITYHDEGKFMYAFNFDSYDKDRFYTISLKLEDGWVYPPKNE